MVTDSAVTPALQSPLAGAAVNQVDPRAPASRPEVTATWSVPVTGESSAATSAADEVLPSDQRNSADPVPTCPALSKQLSDANLSVSWSIRTLVAVPSDSRQRAEDDGPRGLKVVGLLAVVIGGSARNMADAPSHWVTPNGLDAGGVHATATVAKTTPRTTSSTRIGLAGESTGALWTLTWVRCADRGW